MGKLIKGVNGPIKGKVGKISGSSRNGKPYIKGPTKKRTKNISGAERQSNNNFAIAQHWLRPILEFIREGYKQNGLTSDSFIHAKSYLMKNAFDGSGSEITIKPSLVKVSRGDLPLSDNGKVSQSLNQLNFTWDTGTIAGADELDQVMLLAYDIENCFCQSKIGSQFRSTGKDTLWIPSDLGRTYHIYMAFNATDRSRQSDSIYLGPITT